MHVNATSPVGLDVEFDISLPLVPCSSLNIDANDPTGQTQSLHLDRKHHIYKHRIKWDDKGVIQFLGRRSKLEQGSTLLEEEHLTEHLEDIIADADDDDDDDDDDEDNCGSCYGAGDEGECCNTCDDVKRAYGRKGWHLADMESVKQCKKEIQSKAKEGESEGCNVHGIVALDTGGGNFHLAPGRNMNPQIAEGFNVFEMLMKTFDQWNVTHTIHKLRFGDAYPGKVNQLDGIERTIGDSYGMYQYYFKVSGIILVFSR